MADLTARFNRIMADAKKWAAKSDRQPYSIDALRSPKSMRDPLLPARPPRQNTRDAFLLNVDSTGVRSALSSRTNSAVPTPRHRSPVHSTADVTAMTVAGAKSKTLDLRISRVRGGFSSPATPTASGGAALDVGLASGTAAAACATQPNRRRCITPTSLGGTASSRTDGRSAALPPGGLPGEHSEQLQYRRPLTRVTGNTTRSSPGPSLPSATAAKDASDDHHQAAYVRVRGGRIPSPRPQDIVTGRTTAFHTFGASLEGTYGGPLDDTLHNRKRSIRMRGEVGRFESEFQPEGPSLPPRSASEGHRRYVAKPPDTAGLLGEGTTSRYASPGGANGRSGNTSPRHGERGIRRVELASPSRAAKSPLRAPYALLNDLPPAEVPRTSSNQGGRCVPVSPIRGAGRRELPVPFGSPGGPATPRPVASMSLTQAPAPPPLEARPRRFQSPLRAGALSTAVRDETAAVSGTRLRMVALRPNSPSAADALNWRHTTT